MLFLILCAVAVGTQSFSPPTPAWPTAFNITVDFKVPDQNLSIPSLITYAYPFQSIYHSTCFGDPAPCSYLFTMSGVWLVYPTQQKCCLDHPPSEHLLAPAPNWIASSMTYDSSLWLQNNVTGEWQHVHNFTSSVLTHGEDWIHFYAILELQHADDSLTASSSFSLYDGSHIPVLFRDHAGLANTPPLSYWWFTSGFNVGAQDPHAFDIPPYCDPSVLCAATVDGLQLLRTPFMGL